MTEFFKFEKLQVGDIVALRGPEFEQKGWSHEGRVNAVVSRVLDTPVLGTGDIVSQTTLYDVMICVMDNQDEEREAWIAENENREPRKSTYVEFPADSRRLKKIGSIY